MSETSRTGVGTNGTNATVSGGCFEATSDGKGLKSGSELRGILATVPKLWRGAKRDEREAMSLCSRQRQYFFIRLIRAREESHRDHCSPVFSSERLRTLLTFVRSAGRLRKHATRSCISTPSVDRDVLEPAARRVDDLMTQFAVIVAIHGALLDVMGALG
jgi:hypothetical protein